MEEVERIREEVEAEAPLQENRAPVQAISAPVQKAAEPLDREADELVIMEAEPKEAQKKGRALEDPPHTCQVPRSEWYCGFIGGYGTSSPGQVFW